MSFERNDIVTKYKMDAAIAEGGYDAELYCYHSANSADDYEITIVKGTFAELAAKASESIPPNILFRFWNDSSMNIGCTSLVPVYSVQLSASVPFIEFNLSVVWPQVGNLFWNVNDEVYFD